MIKQLIREEVKKIFEDAIPQTGRSVGVAPSGEYFPSGNIGFDEESPDTRWRMSNNKFNDLKKQFNGDINKAIENMPPHMLLYIS